MTATVKTWLVRIHTSRSAMYIHASHGKNLCHMQELLTGTQIPQTMVPSVKGNVPVLYEKSLHLYSAESDPSVEHAIYCWDAVTLVCEFFTAKNNEINDQLIYFLMVFIRGGMLTKENSLFFQ